ncbi:hypothetical protein L2E82_51938 [Cichorium intybus]|nr:hypothetical protein L2E82_51938 [Cichorium intybus]
MEFGDQSTTTVVDVGGRTHTGRIYKEKVGTLHFLAFIFVGFILISSFQIPHGNGDAFGSYHRNKENCNFSFSKNSHDEIEGSSVQLMSAASNHFDLRHQAAPLSAANLHRH